MVSFPVGKVESFDENCIDKLIILIKVICWW